MTNKVEIFIILNFMFHLFQAITACGFTEPTRIQSACIPLALAGRDLCACSATGTGKTAAFMLPVLERLLYRPQQKAMTRVIVLTPTRELAIQVKYANEYQEYISRQNMNISVFCII